MTTGYDPPAISAHLFRGLNFLSDCFSEHLLDLWFVGIDLEMWGHTMDGMIKRTDPSRCVHLIIGGVGDGIWIQSPVLLMMADDILQVRQYSAVESIHRTISLRVIRLCELMLDAKNFLELQRELSVELRTVVGQCLRDTIDKCADLKNAREV